ncbi:DegT/DnrJ/EryC1/StrS aminotransferase family protein [Bosea sp. (in: a-proteobacteria)]|uniref:DegT/DnrJ/EryC1/StrS family aminotransferase n=1 Tax=Bosea sp. (in: a-proteobacteria) TaxID=1871050 RepID=UPI0026106AE8|nr:DegT/DnrJ/EryC1/StrS family aminotransferase [Bosea sp. (in: a-proteobacteria)]MCO5090679.1 DegT/DnrJ/EryC1/StrS family aminotransferase [Bosea sp. (in: a-proteobacteria)]
MSERATIEFIDLKAQRRHIGQAMEDAILKVVRDGNYILGAQVAEFEKGLAAFCGAKHAIGVANGTDALILVLEALGIGPGDAVICPSFTFAATAEVVAWMGATPVFAEIDEATYNLDPKGLAAALDTARQHKLTPRALISVDLFGQACDYDPIEAFCKQNGLVLIADSAQGYGARYKGRVAGAIGDFATTSFFPAKPLGCYGDGGAILTDSDEHAALLMSLRFHGKGSYKYDNVRVGVNSRLDTIQAAVLIEKLKVYAEEIEKRQAVAGRYTAALKDIAVTPHVMPDCVSTWAQYTIRVPAARRDAFQAALKEKGVPTTVYYPKPLHQQTAYRHFPVAGNGLPVSERVAQEVVSLPMHPYLDEETQGYIIAAVREALAAPAAAVA